LPTHRSTNPLGECQNFSSKQGQRGKMQLFNGVSMFLFRGDKFLTHRYTWDFFPTEPMPVKPYMIPMVMRITRKKPPTHIALGNDFTELEEFTTWVNANL